MKICSKCGETKPHAEFYKRAASKDGLSPVCKSCKKSYNAEWHKRKTEKSTGLVTVKTKKCGTCGEVKAVSEFYRRMASNDGLSSRCKTCTRKYHQGWSRKRSAMAPKIEVEEKTCSMCGKTKPISEFYRNATSLDGFREHCKECANKYERKRYAKIVSQASDTPKADEKKCPNCGRIKSASEFSLCVGSIDGLASWCKDCRSSYDGGVREERRAAGVCLSCGAPRKTGFLRCERCLERRRQAMRSYRNKPETKRRLREYYRNYRKNNIQSRVAANLRHRLRRALSGLVKTGSAIRDLGCSVEELIAHLESQFDEEMNWDNYGSGERHWEVDHVLPLSAVDLTKRENVKKVCHYTNLRPLWQIDNIRRNFEMVVEDG